MKKLGLIILTAWVSSCAVYEYSDKVENELLQMSGSTFETPLRSDDLFVQKQVEGARGFITVPLLLKGADLAYQGIISVIDAKKESNITSYKAGLANQRFYADVSKLGRMDPDHLSFQGFSVKRTARIDEEKGLTFSLDASLDTSKLEDIIAGSKFYLTIDNLDLRYTKLKYLDKKLIAPGTWFTKKDKNLNIDVQVDIIATWIDDEGHIHENIKMGNFFFPIRNIDLEQLKNGAYTVKGENFIGSSYLIPRSTTYCLDNRNKRSKCYGLGDFNIEVTITESKENSFIEQKFYENKGALIEAIKGQSIENLLNK